MVYMTGSSLKEIEKAYWGLARDFLGDSAPGESRAFCPGASPPDNSCSPANKGNAGTSAPQSPSPAAAKGSFPEDPRGSLTGHTWEQRVAHIEQVTEWLAGKGVELQHNQGEWTGMGLPPSMQGRKKGPASIDAMDAITQGVEELERLGVALPKKIIVEDISGNAPAACNMDNGVLYFDPDYDVAKVRQSVEEGWLAGVAGKEHVTSMVHEMAHHDHMRAMTDFFKSGGRAVQYLDRWLGDPAPSNGVPTTDPWARYERASHKSSNDKGGPMSEEAAKEVAAQVSEYATRNPLEFVAETRTGLSLGIDYSREVLDLYDDYLGPPVRRPAAQKKKAA
jgi:hypothetical protein